MSQQHTIEKNPGLIALVGPTGCGKSEAALFLAERFRGAIINFDSRQVYRDFPIITAQPTTDDVQRCPHFLYGFLSTAERVDAASFSCLAAKIYHQVVSQGLVPILVGGTGMYLRALTEGLAPIPQIDSAIRAKVQDDWIQLGAQVMHHRLTQIDPVYAARIHPHDRQRVTRAMEVYLGTKQPLSGWHRLSSPFLSSDRILQIGLDYSLSDLTPRLAERIEDMMKLGAMEEVRSAWGHCANESSPGWSGIGCRELLDYHLTRISLAEAKAMWQKRTRAYAKRQLTWFRAESAITWVAPRDYEGMADCVRLFLNHGDASR